MATADPIHAQAPSSLEERIALPPARKRFLVFSDDWGRHPSSCQHLVRHMLDQHEVTWVNTIGMRPPRFDKTTFLRVCDKAKHWLNRNAPETESKTGSLRSPAPTVLNPKMWPWFTRRWDRHINCQLLKRQLIRHVHAETIAITTIPIVCDLMKQLSVQKWVYYCVDDFSEWPGLDQKTMRVMEEQVVKNADILISASLSLQTRLQRMGRDSLLLTHGVDTVYWKAPENPELPVCLKNLEGPFYIFWGVIDQRLDLDYLAALNHALDLGSIILIGPQQNPPPGIFNLSRVHVLPALALNQLPAVGASAQVLIMPYVDKPVTRAMQPLKLLEYLATEKPVVVRDLPATRSWNDALHLARTANEFVSQVLAASHSNLSEAHRIARKRLSDESWSAKAVFFENEVFSSSQP